MLILKYDDRRALHEEEQIYACGLRFRPLDAGWLDRQGAFYLRPGVDRPVWHPKCSSKLFMDETLAPALNPGRGRTKTGCLWAFARSARVWGVPALCRA